MKPIARHAPANAHPRLPRPRPRRLGVEQSEFVPGAHGLGGEDWAWVGVLALDARGSGLSEARRVSAIL